MRIPHTSRIVCSLFLCTLLTLVGCGENASVRVTSNTADSQQKIVNGQLSDPGGFPHVKQLLFLGGETPIPYCTAVFINDTQLVTAAHCINVPNVGILEPSNIGVEISPGLIAPAVAAVPHEQYQGAGVASNDVTGAIYIPFDIGVVTLSAPYTGPVAVVSTRNPTPGQALTLAGYGTTGTNVAPDNQFRTGQTTVDAVSDLDGIIYWVFDGLHEANTCFGDSGGPAFTVFPDNGQPVLVGITSGGAPACEVISLSWDTMVSDSDYLNWLLAQTQGRMLLL